MPRSTRLAPHLVDLLRRALLGASAVFAAALPTPVAAAQATTRVSVDSTGAEGNGASVLPALSADGQVVAFTSSASNLVASDGNGIDDVFVHERATGLTQRVSVDSAGAEGDGASGGAAISADGQIVAFYSFASNLVAGDGNGAADVFVHDRSTGITERVSVDSAGAEGNLGSYFPALSADGQVVAFWSIATNLVAGDTLGKIDVFVHDRANGVTERVSVDSSGAEADGISHYPALSADGQVVVFLSKASNLVANDLNGWSDIFVHDRATGVTECVSVDSSGGAGDADCFIGAALSADGRIVAFRSAATNLVSADANGSNDVFVHDRATGLTERVSVDSAGAEGNDASLAPSLSADGGRVAFTSFASNLVGGDGNGVSDVFVHDRSTGITERTSVDSTGAEGNLGSEAPSLSADGEVTVFASDATNLLVGDGNGADDVFVRDHFAAAWSNYGVGFAGTNGIPSFTSQVDPVLGTTVTLDLGSSASVASVAYVLIGYSETFVPTGKGGDLLVTPAFAFALPLPTTGTTISGDLPDDEALCGFELFAQALELDAGAKRGVSFTAGLKLLLGR